MKPKANMLISYASDIGIRLVNTTQLHVRKAANPSTERDRGSDDQRLTCPQVLPGILCEREISSTTANLFPAA